MPKIVLIAVMLVLAATPQALAVENPHIDTADNSSCLLCHVPGYETADTDAGDFALLEETIDALCLTCHIKTECCVIGQKHMGGIFIGYSHPTDIDANRIQREYLPKTLPLQAGTMTCNTCHFHRRPEGQDYKLVRLVDFTDNGVEWTNLCQDCHADM